MSPASLRGLTWNHPRGFGPLDALEVEARRGEAAPVVWDRQPLEGFESAPLDQLAADYDLLVIDHPHVADAAEAGALVAIDELVGPAELEQWKQASVGPSFDSYTYRGRSWAAPVDAAAQVWAGQLGVEPTPTWSKVAARARRERVVLCVAGPHAFLTWVSLLVAQGCSLGGPGFVERGDGVRALQFLQSLHEHTQPGYDEHNPIQVLEAMARDQSLRFCPLVFGYVNFTRPDPGGSALQFRDAPRWHAGGPRGSVLGGTGLAVSSQVGPSRGEAVEHLRRLQLPQVQDVVVPNAGGQPSALSAWTSPRVNAAARNFYLDTLDTLQTAWVRPRLPGWPRFQDQASASIRHVFDESTSARSATTEIAELFNDLTAHQK